MDESAYEDSVVTSKDTLHILRLAANLHILHQHVLPIIKGEEEEICTEVPRKRLLQAKALYNCITQHKSLFIKVRVIIFIIN